MSFPTPEERAQQLGPSDIANAIKEDRRKIVKRALPEAWHEWGKTPAVIPMTIEIMVRGVQRELAKILGVEP
jgi:hypothetical protein